MCLLLMMLLTTYLSFPLSLWCQIIYLFLSLFHLPSFSTVAQVILCISPLMNWASDMYCSYASSILDTLSLQTIRLQYNCCRPDFFIHLQCVCIHVRFQHSSCCPTLFIRSSLVFSSWNHNRVSRCIWYWCQSDTDFWVTRFVFLFSVIVDYSGFSDYFSIDYYSGDITLTRDDLFLWNVTDFDLLVLVEDDGFPRMNDTYHFVPLTILAASYMST